MRHAIESLCLIALACGTLASCEKEGLSGNGGSKDITFVTSSAPTATRTAYSGEGTTSNNVLTAERIDWVVGDSITIWSDNAVKYNSELHWSNYQVTEVTAQNEKSKATVAPSPINPNTKGLQWTDENAKYVFYGRYPADGTKIDGTSMSAELPSAQTLVNVGTASAPDVQPDMKYAFMFAATKATVTSASDPVTMYFKPEFTALRFEIGGGGDAEAAGFVNLTTFKLTSTSTPLSGSFTITCADSTVNVPTTNSKVLEADFSGLVDEDTTPQLAVASGANSTAITLFAVPADLTNLTLTITGDACGTRTLKLNNADGTPITFKGGKKYVIKGLDIPELLIATGEDINWDVEAVGEDIYWD